MLFGFLVRCAASTRWSRSSRSRPISSTNSNDPIWQRANDLLGLDALPRISSRAEIPPLAVGHFLLLATSFISGFFVGTSRRNSDQLILIGAIFDPALCDLRPGRADIYPGPDAVGAKACLSRQPDRDLHQPQHRRNLHRRRCDPVVLFVLFLSLQSLRFSSIRLLLLIALERTSRVQASCVRSGAALACFFALLLTGSRGGLICTCLGLLVAIVLMVVNRRKPGFWLRRSLRRPSALALTAALLSRTGRIGSQGLFDDGRWSVYGFCLEAIRRAAAARRRNWHLCRPVSLAAQPTISTAGVSGTTLTRQSWKLRSKWEFRLRRWL